MGGGGFVLPNPDSGEKGMGSPIELARGAGSGGGLMMVPSQVGWCREMLGDWCRDRGREVDYEFVRVGEGI